MLCEPVTKNSPASALRIMARSSEMLLRPQLPLLVSRFTSTPFRSPNTLKRSPSKTFARRADSGKSVRHRSCAAVDTEKQDVGAIGGAVGLLTYPPAAPDWSSRIRPHSSSTVFLPQLGSFRISPYVSA